MQEEEKAIEITLEEVQNKISIANGKYAYLQDNTLYVGSE